MTLSVAVRSALLGLAVAPIAAMPLTPAVATTAAPTATHGVVETSGSTELVSAKVPVTRFVTLRPWTSTGRLRVPAKIKKAPAKSSCSLSAVSGRKDAYRCYLGNAVMDTVFKSPTAQSVAVLVGSTWTVYTRIATMEKGVGTAPDKGNPFDVRLTNGGRCRSMTGAGPLPLPKFPYWAGICVGGPYGTDGATWRATVDDGKNPYYPLLALNSAHTKWAAAVEHPEKTVSFVPVVTAYR